MLNDDRVMMMRKIKCVFTLSRVTRLRCDWNSPTRKREGIDGDSNNSFQLAQRVLYLLLPPFSPSSLHQLLAILPSPGSRSLSRRRLDHFPVKYWLRLLADRGVSLRLRGSFSLPPSGKILCLRICRQCCGCPLRWSCDY